MSGGLLCRVTCAVPSLFLLLQIASAQIQTQGALAVEGEQVNKHRLSPLAVIHEKLPSGFTSLNVYLHVIVGPTGRVESVRAENLDQPSDKWAIDQAVAAEKQQRFRPFKKNGVAVRAAFDDSVWIVPPVEWLAPHVPFPQIGNWDTLRITLSRTGCYGVCPEYSVEVRGNGDVLFDGKGNVLMTGHHHGHISQKAVISLVNAFRDADYFSLKHEYVSMITDNSTCMTSIEFDGRHKSVKDYVGFTAGMPEIVMRLEEKIDQTAGTEKWIRETNATGTSGRAGAR